MLRIVILAGVLAAWTAGAAADDLPAQAQRIWAPTADAVGTDNQVTGSVQVLDGHGSEAKGAEDWQLLGKTSGSGLLGWHRTYASGYALDAHVYGTSEAGGLTGRASLQGLHAGGARWTVVARNADHYYDPTSEMLANAFKYPPAPPSLPSTPHLEWRRLDAVVGHRLGAIDVQVGFDRFEREGRKSSLARLVSGTGAAGPETPGVRHFDTMNTGVTAGVRWLGDGRDAGLTAGFRKADGNRALDTRQVINDDRNAWTLRADGGADLGARLRLIGGVAASGLRSEGAETRAAASVTDGETNTVAGRLGLVAGLGTATTVRLVGSLSDQDTDARQDATAGVLYAVDRARTRRELDLSVTDRSLARTRLQLRYRFRDADLDQTTSAGDLPDGAAATSTATLVQDITRHDVQLTARHRVDRTLQLKAKAQWRRLEVDETAGGDALQADLGDRRQERMGWEIAAGLRPARGVVVDAGWRGWDQALTLLDDGDLESTWKASTLFADLQWQAATSLTVYAAASWGNETVELPGAPESAGTMAPVAYDGTTWRLAPGATLQLLPTLGLDGAYELIRYEDTAQRSSLLDDLESDHDRVMLRARWTARSDVDVALTYRRHAFDENRWDDVIQDLWQATATLRF